jgi:uncharacterized protein (DUF427 family)
VKSESEREGAPDVRVERSAKRVRAYLNGDLVVDTIGAALVWEHPAYPTYYVPVGDVRAALEPESGVHPAPDRGEGRSYAVRTPSAVAPGAALRYEESPVDALRDLVRLDWKAMDAWFEEDEEVFGHPRSPYTRIDILPSSRHVRVESGGVTIAESRSPRLLFETGLPVRYYLPKTHVRMDLFVRSETVSLCPYKGWAEYWSLHLDGRVHDDLMWSYRAPLPECQRIAGYVAFYPHRVELFVDGVRQP